MAGTNARTYQVVEGWEQLPKGYEHRDVAGVAVDSEGSGAVMRRIRNPGVATSGV